jgi:hypothetical protein
MKLAALLALILASPADELIIFGVLVAIKSFYRRTTMIEGIQQLKHSMHGMLLTYVVVAVVVIVLWMLLWASKKNLSQ